MHVKGGMGMHIVKLVRSIGFMLLAAGLIYVFFVDNNDYMYVFGFVLSIVFALDGVIAHDEGKRRSFVIMYGALALFMLALSISLLVQAFT